MGYVEGHGLEGSDAALLTRGLPHLADAEPQATTRGRIVIGGRRLEDLFEDVLLGRLNYETNLFKILCGEALDADMEVLAAPMLIGLATGQADGRDLQSVRLAASTHAPFELAILPFLRHCEKFAQTATRLAAGEACAQPPTPSGARLALRLAGMLGKVRPQSKYLKLLETCEVLSADLVVAAFLLEAGLAPQIMPFVKIVARLPAAGAVYLDEIAQRPNRFIGVDAPGAGCGAQADLAETGLALLDEGATFAAVMVRLALGRATSASEAVPINAALIAGAEYGVSPASSVMMRLICDDGVGPADAVQAMISTFGCYHLGALKQSAAVIACVAHGATLDDAIARHALTDSDGRIRVAGFGHRFQKRDPRAVLLLRMCQQLYPGKYIEAACLLDDALGERRIGYINMDGIGAAMGLQGGMAPDIVSLLTLVARTPGIAKALRQATPMNGDCELRVRNGLK